MFSVTRYSGASDKEGRNSPTRGCQGRAARAPAAALICDSRRCTLTGNNRRDLYICKHFRLCMRGASRREVPVQKRIRCEVTSGANHVYK